MGIQLTATRDRSLRRFLLGLTGITRGGCSRWIRSDYHGNLPRRFSAPGAVRDPTISRGINDKKRCRRRAPMKFLHEERPSILSRSVEFHVNRYFVKSNRFGDHKSETFYAKYVLVDSTNPLNPVLIVISRNQIAIL